MLLSPPFSPFRLNGRAELRHLYHRRGSLPPPQGVQTGGRQTEGVKPLSRSSLDPLPAYGGTLP